MFKSDVVWSLLSAFLLKGVVSQEVGKEQYERKPNITWQSCTSKDECAVKKGQITLDANWRWLHDKGGYSNCFYDNTWDPRVCPTNSECTKKCAIEGADYKGTYGISANASRLDLRYLTHFDYASNMGSRMYLASPNNTYELFKLAPNREFSFDVDVSQLACGLNGALYFVSMDADGGMARYPTNKAGANYGTGYCDAECPRNLKYVNGQANVEGWMPSETDPQNGRGNYGSCCAEMRIWDANSMSTSFAAKPCTTIEQSRCEGTNCGGPYSRDYHGGICDPEGCDLNPYRTGNTDFYGRSTSTRIRSVDTSRKFTVVTQFLGSGADLEVKRFYIQNGTIIPSPSSRTPGVQGNSLTSKFCDQQKAAFGDRSSFQEKGGMAAMSRALEKGMVLVISILDDHYSHLLWLDSVYPPDSDPKSPGVLRGECDPQSGNPTYPNNLYPDRVAFSNIKIGPLNSTFQ